MNVYNGEKKEPNAKMSVEYVNDNCVGIRMEPISMEDASGRIGINALVFHISRDNFMEIVKKMKEE